MDKLRNLINHLAAEAWCHGNQEGITWCSEEEIKANDDREEEAVELILAKVQKMIDEAKASTATPPAIMVVEVPVPVRVFEVAPCGDVVIIF